MPEKRFSPAARVRIVLQEIFWLLHRVIYRQSTKSPAKRALASCKTLARRQRLSWLVWPAILLLACSLIDFDLPPHRCGATLPTQRVSADLWMLAPEQQPRASSQR